MLGQLLVDASKAWGLLKQPDKQKLASTASQSPPAYRRQRIFHDGQGAVPSDWYKLTPDINGSYLNGTLTLLTPLPGTYSPLYFSSQILKDGRLLIEGGEYNQNNSVWTNQGAIYDPLANTWTPRTPPAGWTQIGDAASIMLSDQTYLQTNCCNSGPKFAVMAPP